MSRPITVAPAAQYPAHANNAHTKGVSTQASKQAGAKGRRDHTAPATPSKRANTKKAQTPQANTGSSANTKPSHPQANTPTSKPQQGTPPSEHKERPRQSAWASKMCERGNPRALAGATGMKQSRRNPPKAGTQKQAHTRRARKQWGLRRPCRPAPAQQGVRRERKAAHNSPRQSAWVVVFVGVFADVCRRFWAGWFGGLGVFWGCLACFLVF